MRFLNCHQYGISSDFKIHPKGFHRFGKEAQVLWNLIHTHILHVMDFLVMDDQLGQNLEQNLAVPGGKLNFERAKEPDCSSEQGMGNIQPQLVKKSPATAWSGQILTKQQNSLGMTFVLIPAGKFIMGSPPNENKRGSDETQHQVTLMKSYYLQTSPVTQDQWTAVMGNNPSHFTGNPNLPVEQVSWHDCQSYIQKLNAKNDGLYRLPTEAEWEYACRAGTTGPFGIGNGYVLDSSLANFDGNFPYGKGAKGEFRRQTTPVESFLPNAWGLYDMHGNVWEWCQDGYEKYSTESVTDPWGQNDSDIRVYRGGCWVDCGRQCRSAYRFSYYPDFKRYDLGFRLVMLV